MGVGVEMVDDNSTGRGQAPRQRQSETTKKSEAGFKVVGPDKRVLFKDKQPVTDRESAEDFVKRYDFIKTAHMGLRGENLPYVYDVFNIRAGTSSNEAHVKYDIPSWLAELLKAGKGGWELGVEDAQGNVHMIAKAGQMFNLRQIQGLGGHTLVLYYSQATMDHGDAATADRAHEGRVRLDEAISDTVIFRMEAERGLDSRVSAIRFRSAFIPIPMNFQPAYFDGLSPEALALVQNLSRRRRPLEPPAPHRMLDSGKSTIVAAGSGAGIWRSDSFSGGDGGRLNSEGGRPQPEMPSRKLGGQMPADGLDMPPAAGFRGMNGFNQDYSSGQNEKGRPSSEGGRARWEMARSEQGGQKPPERRGGELDADAGRGMRAPDAMKGTQAAQAPALDGIWNSAGSRGRQHVPVMQMAPMAVAPATAARQTVQATPAAQKTAVGHRAHAPMANANGVRAAAVMPIANPAARAPIANSAARASISNSATAMAPIANLAARASIANSATRARIANSDYAVLRAAQMQAETIRGALAHQAIGMPESRIATGESVALQPVAAQRTAAENGQPATVKQLVSSVKTARLVARERIRIKTKKPAGPKPVPRKRARVKNGKKARLRLVAGNANRPKKTARARLVERKGKRSKKAVGARLIAAPARFRVVKARTKATGDKIIITLSNFGAGRVKSIADTARLEVVEGNAGQTRAKSITNKTRLRVVEARANATGDKIPITLSNFGAGRAKSGASKPRLRVIEGAAAIPAKFRAGKAHLEAAVEKAVARHAKSRATKARLLSSPVPVRAILFDLDGVLSDSEELHWQTYNALFARYGVHIPKAYWFSHYTGTGSRNIMADVIERFNLKEDVNHLVEERMDIFQQAMAQGRLQPMAGARELVRWAEKKGLKIAVASAGNRRNVEAQLKALGLETLPTVTLEDVKHGKPHPEVFRTAAAKIGVQPSECLVIEDAASGLKAARAGGMRCVLIGSHHPAKVKKKASKWMGKLSAKAVARWIESHMN